MCLQQVLAGVMHNNSSLALSVGLTDGKKKNVWGLIHAPKSIPSC